MPIKNYKTTIEVDKTIGEIQKAISNAGALRIMVDYKDGSAAALSFQIVHNHQPISFKLPANWQGVLKAMQKQKVAKAQCNQKQAMRVTWRIIKDWITSQMAIIEAEQASLATVFLPYAVMENGSTVSDNLLSDKGNQLLLH